MVIVSISSSKRDELLEVKNLDHISVGIKYCLALSNHRQRNGAKQLYGLATSIHSCPIALDMPIVENNIFQFIPINKAIPSHCIRISKVFTKTNFCFLLTDEGYVYSSGENNWSQCGTKASRTTEFQLIKSLVLEGVRIVDISQGYAHTAMLSDRGDVYVCGGNIFGQLGAIRGIMKSETPFRVQFERYLDHKRKNICKIGSGYAHVLCATDTGDIIGFGNNFSNQLGLPHGADKIFAPTFITNFPAGVRKISCGQSFSAVLTNDFHVYVCGENRDQILFNNPREYVVPSFTRLHLSGIRDIECSQNVMSLITHNNKLYMSGTMNFRGIKNGSTSGPLREIILDEVHDCTPSEELHVYHNVQTMVVYKTKRITFLSSLSNLYSLRGKLTDTIIICQN
jgi:alpha-tubulin suppressor-like RCC1 family protein